jgi:AcrR family transcriptional regulator
MGREREKKLPTRKYLERQEEILRVATGILNRKGLKDMTLAQAADHFGIVATGLSYYFRSKEALAAACFRRAIAAHDALVAEAAEQPTFEERVGHLVRRYFERLRAIALGEADDIALFEDLRSLDDRDLEADYVALFRRVRRLFAGDGRSLADRARLNARTHYLLQQLIWARYWSAKYDPRDYARAAERMTDILLRGLGAGPRPWAPTRLSLPPPPVGEDQVKRETFLRAATQLINEQGYRGASVERIAARLDVTKGSFYYRIDAKDDLIEICYMRTVEVMQRAQQDASELPGDGYDRLASALAHLIDHQLLGDVPLLRFPTASVPETIKQKILLNCDRIDVRFGSAISDGVADGSLRPVDVQIAAHMLTAAAIAGAELAGWLPGPADGRTSENFLRPVFAGLAEGAPRSA